MSIDSTNDSARDQCVRQALRAAGCRYTKQRAMVLAYLEGVTDHPSAEDIYQAVRRSMPKISLATVYKALEALVASKLATKLVYGDASARYDCRGEEHYHFRDTKTGDVRDLPAAFDPQLLDKLDPKLVGRLAAAGFQVTGYRLEVIGQYIDSNK